MKEQVTRRAGILYPKVKLSKIALIFFVVFSLLIFYAFSASYADLNHPDAFTTDGTRISNQTITSTDRIEETDPSITYTGLWNVYSCSSCSGGALKYSNQTGATANFSFNATTAKLIVAKANMLGKIKVYLDSVYFGMVDLYSPTTKWQVVLQKSGLSPGLHSVTLEVSGQKNPNSAGYSIDLDAFEILTDEIWIPPLVTSWQWQLSGTVNQSYDVDMYDIDMFDNDAGVVSSLHGKGSRVICYISAGSWESWRPDASDFPPSVLGNPLEGWSGERWLDIRQIETIGPIMTARMDLCRQKGFDGIEPDNIDGYLNDTGFPLTYQDQLNYNIFLANEAHERGLSIGLKNDMDQIQDLLAYYDWALNEQCFEFLECNKLLPFINAGKAVFEVEYNLPTSSFCPVANKLNFNSMKKHIDLDAWREPCR
jgi:hypothetical protein